MLRGRFDVDEAWGNSKLSIGFVGGDCGGFL